MSKKVALIILDGWGHGKKDQTDAIFNANTPFVDSLYSSAPNAELLTHGVNVGLPEGQMGNSEVGHMNIGAGRVVYQDLLKINRAIEDKSFFNHEVLINAINHAKKENVSFHLMGLVSDGGVHSSQEHLHALCDMLQEHEVPQSFIHVFTDGRDTNPNNGLKYIKALEAHLEGKKTKIASLIGRYYAMDRDQRWERISLAYQLLVKGEGSSSSNPVESIEKSYAAGITDEFIDPVKFQLEGTNQGHIKNGDVVVCFNFRTDRCRQITTALTQEDMPDHNMSTLNLHYVTMTNYDKGFKNVHVAYDKDNLQDGLGETLSNAGKTQVRIAETEKYPHVTFFFNGGRETPFEGENRLMAESPKVPTYDLKPEMSAFEIRDAILPVIKNEEADFICLNFANPDMVGHTGVFEAIQKACETVDGCLKEIVEAGTDKGYSFVVIADHGNADLAVNEDGSANTAHSTNPVPIFIIDQDTKKVENGILADVAPTILHLMGVSSPDAITGKNLIS